MHWKTLSIGVLAISAIVLSLSLFIPASKILIFKSWLHGNQFTLNNSRITLKLDDYILPHEDGNPIVIRDVSSGMGLLEVNATGPSLAEGHAFALKECRSKDCTSITQRISTVNRRKVTAVELQFHNSQTGDSIEAFYWIEGVPILIQFNGPTTVYPHYRATISNIINQASR